MIAILKRELRDYFCSQIAYIFMAVFLLLSGVLFYLQNILSGDGRYGYTMSSMIMILIFSIPMLTMRSIAEERRQKTDQLLFTSPITTTQIVIGKYLAIVLVFVVTSVISLIYPAILFWLAKPVLMEIIIFYIGFILLGAALIAVSLFASSFTKSQVAAGFLGLGFLILLLLINSFASIFENPIWKETVYWLSLVDKYSDFASSELKISPMVYMISVISLFNYLTILQLEKRRFSEGG